MSTNVLRPNFPLCEDFGRKWFFPAQEGKTDAPEKKLGSRQSLEGRDEENGASVRPEARSKKPPPVPLSALLRTRIDQGVPQGRFLDPTT